jgi:hypothetical protein
VSTVSSEQPVWSRLAHHHRGWSLPLALGAIAAVSVTHLVDYGVYGLRYWIFNANSDASWSHGVVTGLLGIGAAVCLAGAWRLPGQRAAWLATAAILALFFVGEVSEVHAEVDALSRLLYAPVLVVLVYCVWRLTRGGAYYTVVRAGAALLVTSYAIHVLEPTNIAGAFGFAAYGWACQTVVALKEGTELAGVLLALLALWGAAAATAQNADEAPFASSQVRAREGR